MKRTIWLALIPVAILCLAGITHGQAPAPADSPAALYAQVQQLEADIAAADEEMRAIEHQIDRAQKASENCDLILERTDGVIERLARWAEAK